ncbi:hypothetical protein [Microbulbifer sp. SSSA005]|uniref:hypothetical protein n=1 Tax=unclassified Microbulbifer TaxID=2619833 RepID=UPI00403A33F2
MIAELRLSVLLRGEKFSPKEAENVTGLRLQDKLELGEISPRGPYRGKPVPYGTAQLEVPAEIPYDNRLMWIIRTLEVNLKKLYGCGAEETRIYAGYFYKDQCNFCFNREELSAIAKLDIDFAISCYDISDEE